MDQLPLQAARNAGILAAVLVALACGDPRENEKTDEKKAYEASEKRAYAKADGPRKMQTINGLPGMPMPEPPLLLSYEPWAGAPEECGSPERLLDYLAREINAGPRECRARRSTGSASRSGELLELDCRFEGEAGCADIYYVRIWPQRDSTAPSGGYRIFGMPMLNKTCPELSDEKGRTYPPSPHIADNIRRDSNMLEDLLHDKCAPQQREDSADPEARDASSP